MKSTRATRARMLLALALVATLLFAVHLGQRHRIAHGLQSHAHDAPAAKAGLHSCAALDEATLADRLPSAQHMPALGRRECLLPLSFAATAAPRLAAPPFAARAPPSA